MALKSALKMHYLKSYSAIKRSIHLEYSKQLQMKGMRRNNESNRSPTILMNQGKKWISRPPINYIIIFAL